MRKFTLIMVPKTGGRIRELRFSIPVLLFLVAAVIFGYVSLYLTTRGIRPFLADKTVLENLRQENDRLDERVADLARKIVAVRHQMNVIHEKEAEIRKMTDLLDETPRARAETRSGITPETPLPDIRSQLRNLERLSQYYDSLVSAISPGSGRLEAVPTIRPVPAEAYVSARFGDKIDPFSGERKPHLGVDFAFAAGTAVVAAAAGTVVSARHEKGFGKTIRINHGAGFATMYAHLQAFNVSPGQTVSKGQKIGALGSSGRAIGPHLHYEVTQNGRNLDPEDFF